MRLVRNIDEILENLLTFKAGLESGQRQEAFRQKLGNGRVFIVSRIAGKRVFAPSRFVGYAHNSLPVHARNDKKDGRETNAEISRILGKRNEAAENLEKDYRRYCQHHGAKVSNNSKTFWELGTSSVSILKDRSTGNSRQGGARNTPNRIENDIKEILSENDGTHKLAEINARIGQGKFRASLLRKYGRCVVTGCRELGLLRASHIKPWHACNSEDRMNPENGLLLVAHLDAAFDAGLISFDNDGRLLAEKLKPEDRKILGINQTSRINSPTNGMCRFLRVHRRLHEFKSRKAAR